MNDIEKAISNIKNHGKTMTEQDAFVIIQALHETAEREKGCEHCRGWDTRCGAKYCPMCGRKLGEQNG